MKKSDRWERMVLKKANPDFLIGTNEAIYLLRKEHAWLRRTINAYDRSIQGFKDHPIDPQWKKGYAQACMEILHKLKERAK